MQRYVMANRTAGKTEREAKIASAASLSAALEQISSAQVIETHGDDEEMGRIVLFEADAAEVERKRAGLPADAILEPEILHWPADAHISHTEPVEYARTSAHSASTMTAAARPFVLTVEGGGRPLSGADATLYARGLGGGQRRSFATSDADGKLNLSLDDGFVASCVVVAPQCGFWPTMTRGPTSGDVISCAPLPRLGPGGWWHAKMHVGPGDASLGEGVRVGVADTGCGPHPDLEHVTLLGKFDDTLRMDEPANGADAQSHGSHVTGIIGGRPVAEGGYAGLAPGCDLFHVRVFEPGRLANQADIALAVELLSRDHQCDLINLSLGARGLSQVLRDRIGEAMDRGTLCVCAAGNNGGDVLYPAALEDCVAVGAVGAFDSKSPAGSLSAGRFSGGAGEIGEDNLYLANFSNRGSAIDCVGPGVGLIAAVPDRLGTASPAYAAKDGTSMAAPAVCGLLASTLSNDQVYLALPRDRSRAEHARGVLRRNCRDIGLRSDLQGRGMPQASP